MTYAQHKKNKNSTYPSNYNRKMYANANTVVRATTYGAYRAPCCYFLIQIVNY